MTTRRKFKDLSSPGGSLLVFDEFNNWMSVSFWQLDQPGFRLTYPVPVLT